MPFCSSVSIAVPSVISPLAIIVPSVQSYSAFKVSANSSTVTVDSSSALLESFIITVPSSEPFSIVI